MVAKNGMIKAIIFDLGSVVYKTNWAGLNNDFREKFGFDIRPFKSKTMESSLKEKIISMYKDAIVGKSSIRDVAIYLGHEKDADKIIAYYKKSYFLNKILNKKMLEIIKRLKKDYTLYAITDINKEHYEADQEGGLFDMFEKVFASHLIGKRKNDIAAFHEVLKKIDFKPEECLFIDNLENNVDNAKATGMKVICYPDFPNMGNFKKELDHVLKEKKG